MSRRIGSASPAVVLQAEKDIKSRLKGQHFDFTAMSAVSNVYRAGTAVRNHMERTVLAEYDLSWVAFTVLWVLWIWDTQETGHVAEEAGVTKGTLTGVIKTPQGRDEDWIRRLPPPRRPSTGLHRVDRSGRTPHRDSLSQVQSARASRGQHAHGE